MKRNVKKSYNRIIEISPDARQITLPDARYYRRNGEYYPSITYVLSHYPKGKFFEDWLKKVGYSADFIVKKAGEEGTQVHEMIEQYLNGKELNFLSEFGNPQYHPDIWQMFLRFVEWWEEYKPTLIETEVHLFSDELKVAGTCDMVCEIDGEIWIVDFKTSNNLQTVYDLQTAVYGKCYEECYGKTPQRYGILWLKSSKRTQEENLDIFLTVKKLFDLENPKHSPIFTEFKTTVKREL